MCYNTSMAPHTVTKRSSMYMPRGEDRCLTTSTSPFMLIGLLVRCITLWASVTSAWRRLNWLFRNTSVLWSYRPVMSRHGIISVMPMSATRSGGELVPLEPPAIYNGGHRQTCCSCAALCSVSSTTIHKGRLGVVRAHGGALRG